MNNSVKPHRHIPFQRRHGLRPTPIAAAISGLLYIAGSAYAQQAPEAQAPDTKIETVVVSGVRHSIETSTATKRNSDDIVEAVSAEDIGKLPDVSIAESISRLPGIAAQNVDGRAQVISIRGMSPDFAGTLLNGREQTSTGVNRGVEFDQYPAELMSSVVVYKTPDGTLLGQGISGTVDMRTVRPLDIAERKVVLNAKGEDNSLGSLNGGYGGTSKIGERFNAAYIDQFADRTVGVALGYAYLDTPGQQQHYKSWWWGAPGNTLPNNQPWYNGATASGGSEIEALSRKDVRNGLMGTLEYKPNKDFHSTLDAYYSTFTENEVMRGLMFDSNPWNDASQPWVGGPQHFLTNPGYTTVGGVQVLNSGTINFPAGAPQPVVRNDYNTRDDHLASLGWNNDLKVGDWRVIADLSYSSAKTEQKLFETYAGTPSSSINFNIPTGAGFPTFTSATNFADPSAVALGDPGGWGHDGRLQTTNQKDEIKALNIHVKHDLGWIFSQIDTGINYSMRDKTQNFIVDFASLKNGGASQLISPSLAQAPTSLGFAGIPGVLSYDVNSIASRYYNMTQNMSGGPGGDYSHDFGVHERITTAYAKADIDTEIGTIPVHGNLGAQWIHTNQSSNAYAFSPTGNNGPIGTIDVGTSYNDFLPSLNLVADLPDDKKLRFGLAKTLARPRIDDMNASYQASVDPTTHLWGGSGGNPMLHPWLAESADLSLEKYWGKRSYLAGAVFYKELSTYIYQQSTNYNFAGYVNPTPAVQPLSNMGQYSTQANGTGGYMRGAEFSGALDAGLLSKNLDGFGAQFSISYTGSSIQVDGPGSSTPIWATLPGLSKKVAGLTLYYDKDGYSFRINDRYRSDFRGEYSSLFGATSVLRTLAMNTVDLQAGYEFQQGQYKGLSLIFEIANLTNAAERNVQDGTGFGGVTQPQETNRYGSVYLFGVNYKM